MIATILNVHSYSECAIDTLDSIKTFVGDEVMMIIDGLNWDDWLKVSVPAYKVKGFPHGVSKAPYRNVALSLMCAYEKWEADWYCYTEYDVLFTSERFKNNLAQAENMDVWMLGNDGQISHVSMPLIEALIGEQFKKPYYLLGCCQFFHRKFLDKLNEINFFQRFLNLTNNFSGGDFPKFDGYDLSENMYPTLCRHFGGNIGVFAHYDECGKWHGAYEYFPMRWKPEIDPETENFPDASIIHPLKTNDHPLRVLHRERRNQWNCSKQKEKMSD